MTPLMRFLQRLIILGLGALTVWFVVFVVFEEADHQPDTTNTKSDESEQVHS